MMGRVERGQEKLTMIRQQSISLCIVSIGLLVVSNPVSQNSCLTVASAPSFSHYIAAHDLINIIMFSPPFKKKSNEFIAH